MRREALRLDQERVEGDLHAPAVVGIEHELAPLLDERLGERLGEGPLRQREIDRLAAPLLLGLVLGEEGQLDPRAGPGMLGEVDGGLGLGLALRIGRQRRAPCGAPARARGGR